MLDNFFYNPSGLDYVADSVLWSKIFKNPFPRNLNNPEEGSINLNEYFSIKSLTYRTVNGTEDRRAICARKKFYLVHKIERDIAFLALCNFLVHFNRPYRDCIMQLPKHPGARLNKDFFPIDIYYDLPDYPCIDLTQNMIRIKFEEELYHQAYEYSFGKNMSMLNTEHIISYSFACFCSFILHY